MKTYELRVYIKNGDEVITTSSGVDQQDAVHKAFDRFPESDQIGVLRELKEGDAS